MNKYALQIIYHDEILRTLRKSWLASTGDDKQEWLKQIDAALDHRLELMKKRDQTLVLT